MPQKVLAILASPRRRGNSEILLKEALKKLKNSEIKIIRTSLLNISCCLGCGFCERWGCCKISDDFQKVAGFIRESDLVVVSSPIYFYHLPSHFKALIDRSQSFWSRKYILKKIDNIKQRPVFTILVGATKGEKLFVGAQLTLKYFYDAYNLRSSGELLIRGVDKKGEIKKYPLYLRQSKSLIKIC